MKKIYLHILICLTMSSFASLSAQVDLEISVIDLSTGKSLPDAVVRLDNEAIGYSQEKTTNSQGKVRFVALQISGVYLASVAETDTFYEVISPEISLRSNTSASVVLFLPKKTELNLNEIVISGNSTQINTLNAEVSSQLQRQEILEIPIEGRDITRSLYRLPNVSQATGFYPEAPNVSINGANGLFTNYLIDGLDNNERFLGGQKFAIPIGFAQNVSVLTNNFSAEYGNTANGVVNITSRSGSNVLSGEVFSVLRPGPALDASSPYAQRDLSGNPVKDGFQRYQAGFALGGALVQDKTFFFINAEHSTDLKDNLLNVTQLNINETVRGQNKFNYLSAKIDQLWSKSFHSSLRANVGFVNIERQGGGLEGGVGFPSSGNSQDRNSVLLALKNSYNQGNFTFESNYQYARFRWNYGKADNPNSPQVSVLAPDNQTIAVLGHPGYVFDATESTFQTQQKIAYYAGKHTLKAGFEVISANHSLAGGGNPNGNYTVQLSPSQLNTLQNANLGSGLSINDIPSEVTVLNYNVELRPNTFGTTQNVFSLYLEDEISVNDRLNLSLGLRYDYDNLSKGGGNEGDFNNIAPRLSFNYKINSRSSLRGGYGIFYDKILYAVYSDALQQNTTSADYKAQLQELVNQGILPADTDLNKITFDGNLSASANNVTYLQGPSAASLQNERDNAFSNERRILNPNGYQNPYSHQFSLGYQQQISQHNLFYVDLVHNRSYNLFRIRDLNAPAPYPLTDPDNVTVRTQAEADATRPVPIENGTATINGQSVQGVARNVIVSETAGEARYYAASFNFQKRQGEDKFAYRFIYTLSFLENNTDDINFRAQDANNFGAEWGPSVNDRTHILNGIFQYFPLEGLNFTLAALIQSGQPINRIPDATLYGTTDLNGDGRSFGDAYVGNSDRSPGESRNNDRLPWSNTFDLGVQYQLKTGKKSFIEMRADIFNILNAENLSGYANNATQSNQIQVGARSTGVLVRRNAAPPRQFQFGLRYAF